MFKKLVMPSIFTNLEFLFFMNDKGKGVGWGCFEKERHGLLTVGKGSMNFSKITNSYSLVVCNYQEELVFKPSSQFCLQVSESDTI